MKCLAENWIEETGTLDDKLNQEMIMAIAVKFGMWLQENGYLKGE